MAGLFSSPKAPPPPPGPDPELLRKQQQQQEISARRRARSGAGSRQLIFQARLDPALGIPFDTTFGPGVRNPDRENA